jgi:hypothetical protein
VTVVVVGGEKAGGAPLGLAATVVVVTVGTVLGNIPNVGGAPLEFGAVMVAG